MNTSKQLHNASRPSFGRKLTTAKPQPLHRFDGSVVGKMININGELTVVINATWERHRLRTQCGWCLGKIALRNAFNAGATQIRINVTDLNEIHTAPLKWYRTKSFKWHGGRYGQQLCLGCDHWTVISADDDSATGNQSDFFGSC